MLCIAVQTSHVFGECVCLGSVCVCVCVCVCVPGEGGCVLGKGGGSVLGEGEECARK